MNGGSIEGRIHSIQSLGTVDGPGVRFVAFLSGCPLRCACCHNPDTWDFGGGDIMTASELVRKVERFRTYFGEKGGITLSGGEPLCQAEFADAVFGLCLERGINTCLDTSGVYLDDKVKSLLSHTGRVLLDIKYTSDELYRQNVGMPLSNTVVFLDYLNGQGIPTTVRQVVIPGVNDSDENYAALKKLIKAHKCVDSLELLPFRKICQVKYDSMEMRFPFEHIPEADVKTVREKEAAMRNELFNDN